jgi:hypothetical protein
LFVSLAFSTRSSNWVGSCIINMLKENIELLILNFYLQSKQIQKRCRKTYWWFVNSKSFLFLWVGGLSSFLCGC